MNLQAIEIPNPPPLASTPASGNAIPATTESVAPPSIDPNLLTAHASYAAAHFVAISRMISSVTIGASPQSTNIIQDEKVATTPSPTILMCSAVEACSTCHVYALGEEEEGDVAFEEAVRSFFSFDPCFFSHLNLLTKKCRAPNLLPCDQFRSCAVLAEQTQIK